MRRRKVWLLTGVLFVELAVGAYRWTGPVDLPLRKSMTASEVQAVVGTRISGGSSSMTHLDVVYDLEPDWIGIQRRVLVSYDPRPGDGGVISWEMGPSRLRRPPWLEQALGVAGW